jgi:hypothetical protein
LKSILQMELKQATLKREERNPMEQVHLISSDQ